MAKTVILSVPDTFDFGKLVTALGASVEGLQILKPNQRVEVLDALPLKNGKSAGKRQGYRKEGKSVVTSIMDHFTPQGEFTSTHAQSWVHQEKYDINSASPALTALKKGGFVLQIGQGKFRFMRPLAHGTDVRAVLAAAR